MQNQEDINLWESLNIRSQLQGLCGYCLLAYDWIGPLAEWIGQKKVS